MSNKSNLSRVMYLVCTDTFLANDDELSLIQPKFARPLFFPLRLLGTFIKYRQRKIVNIFAFKFATAFSVNLSLSSSFSR